MKGSQYLDEYRKNLRKGRDKRSEFREFLKSVKGEPMDSMEKSSSGMAENNEPDGTDLDDAIEIVQDAGIDTEIRMRALEGVSYEIGMHEGAIEAVLGLLRDQKESLNLRQAALSVLKRLTFTSAIFRSRSSEYTEILRSIISEAESPLRVQAIEILSRLKDEYLQRRLVAGLEGEEEGLVSPEKAIQLLGYDVHAGIFPLLRDIVKDPPNAVAKNEAVRILAADSDSKDLIRETLLDKNEDRFVRQTSAAALSSLAPEEFEEVAKQIVLDDEDYDDIRATSVTLLEFSSVREKKESSSVIDGASALESAGLDVAAKIEDLGNTASGDLKKASERFISKLEIQNRR